MQSKLYKYVAFIFRKPLNTLVILGFILMCYVGWTIVNILNTRKVLDAEQSVVNYIAENLKVRVKAGDTAETAHSVQITLSNTGSEDISFGQWRIYLYAWRLSRTKHKAGFEVGWVNGGLYFLSPIKDEFLGISAGKSLNLRFEGWKSSAKTDFQPNWYVASSSHGLTFPRIIESTKGESLSFVSPFENSYQWKRHKFDKYNPYTPRERYKMHRANAFKRIHLKGGFQVIPTPFSVKIVSGKHVIFDKTWVVVNHASMDSEHAPASRILTTMLKLKESPQQTKNGKYIKFKTDKKLIKEQYEIKVVSKAKVVEIISNSDEGAFYGVQTLTSMLESSNTIPEGVIKDHPRFPYRGLMIDVVRNFHKKETIKKIINVMSMYKMNKLHMHLTDDEGWRIEIPTLPELTKYSSRRCHNFKNDKCLNPSLGSGPNSDTSGSGFYTVSDFREILRYAKERFVQVIPEIDIPGHASSAIKAMLFREQNHKNEKRTYILSDDVSGIPSVQGWVGNSINPCLNATYRFVETVLSDLRIIYQGIQNLELVHVGGDEVPNGVLERSSICRSMFPGPNFDHNIIKKMFLFTVADIAHKHGLKISAWEDGLYYKGKGPYDAKEFRQNEVFVNTWHNALEAGRGGRAIQFADLGYRVILSQATHLYFDHPYEPDPEERGLYWATRYIDTYKVFGFMPFNVYANAEFDSFGNKINLNDLCKGPCPKLEAHNNIAGMEACVWSERIRNESQLMSMVFPRLLAFAERAWHKADWESINVRKKREVAKRMDFSRFVHIVGSKELSRLDKAGVLYRIPPPGLIFSEEKRIAKFNTFYPEHKVMVSLGNDSKWRSVGKEIKIPVGISDIRAYALSPVLNRRSRAVSLHIKNSVDTIYFSMLNTGIMVMMSLQFMENR